MTGNGRIELRWKMNSRNSFEAEYEDLLIIAYPPTWFIIRGDEVLEAYYEHKPTYNELACRVQAERILYKLMQTHELHD